MKQIPYQDVIATFKGRTIMRSRTKKGSSLSKPVVDITFRDDTGPLYQLRTQRGWKFSSALLNTLHYQPKIEDAIIEIEGGEVHLTLYGRDDYVIAEYSAKRSTGADVAVWPFEIIVLEPGDVYTDVMARQNR